MISDLPPGTDGYEGLDSVLYKKNVRSNSKERSETNMDLFFQSHQIKFTDGTVGPMFGLSGEKNEPTYLCYPCEATCYSERSLQDHMNGKRHTNNISVNREWSKKVVTHHPFLLLGKKPAETSSELVKDSDKSVADTPSQMMEYFKTIKVPLIGLEYFIEIISDGTNDTVFCTMCNKKGVLNVITNHITSVKHKYKYFSLHFPTVYRKLEKYRSQVSTSGTCVEIVNNICDRIERDYGRQKLITVEESEFSLNSSHYIQMAASAHHISERDGKSYTEMVDDSYVLAMSKRNYGNDGQSSELTKLKPTLSKEEEILSGDKIIKDAKDYNIKITLKTTALPQDKSNEELKDLRENLNERRAKKDLRGEIDRISSRKIIDDEMQPRDSQYGNRYPPTRGTILPRSRSPYRKRPHGLRSPPRQRSPYRRHSPHRLRSPLRRRSPQRLRSPFKQWSPPRLRSPFRGLSRSRSPISRTSPPSHSQLFDKRSHHTVRSPSIDRERSYGRIGSLGSLDSDAFPKYRNESARRKEPLASRHNSSKSPLGFENDSPRDSNRRSKSPSEEMKISPLLLGDYYSMPFSEFRSMDWKYFNAVVKKNYHKANIFQDGYIKIVDNMKSALQFHEKYPERHPFYDEEWKKFWNKRYKELKSENVDVNSYNFKPEWIVYWSQKIKAMHEEELEIKKSELCRKLNLPSSDVELKKLFQDTLDCIVGYAKKLNKPPAIVQKLINEEEEKKALVKRKRDELLEKLEEQKAIVMRAREDLIEKAEGKKILEGRGHHGLVDYSDGRSRSRSSTRYPKSSEPTGSSFKSYQRNYRQTSPISEDSLSDGEPPHLMEQRYKKKKMYGGKERERSHESNAPDYTDIIKCNDDINVISVLRLLTALENYLGSLGAKVVDLLTLALKMEKDKPNSSEKILLDDEHSVLFETVKEKLKGQLLAGLIDSNAVQATKKAIQYSASLIHKSTKLVEEEKEKKKKEEIKPSKQVVPVTGIGSVEKAAIAHQIASALIAQGRTNVTTNELESLVNAVVGMVDKENDTNKHSVPKEAIVDKKTSDNSTANALQMLQSAYASQAAQKKVQVVEEEPQSSTMEGLSDSDLQTLLQNFEDLSSDEQNGLITYLKNLEKKDPKRVESLRKFVSGTSSLDTLTKEKSPLALKESKFVGNVAEKSLPPKVNKEPVKMKESDEEDDDDYTFDDVLKSASAKVQENQLQDAMQVVAQSIIENKPKDTPAFDINSIMSSLLGSQESLKNDKSNQPDTSYENISKVLGLVATLSGQSNSNVATLSNISSGSSQSIVAKSNDTPPQQIDPKMPSSELNNASYNMNRTNDPRINMDNNAINMMDDNNIVWGKSQFSNNQSDRGDNNMTFEENLNRNNMMATNFRSNMMQSNRSNTNMMMNNRNNFSDADNNYQGDMYESANGNNMDYDGNNRFSNVTCENTRGGVSNDFRGEFNSAYGDNGGGFGGNRGGFNENRGGFGDIRSGFNDNRAGFNGNNRGGFGDNVTGFNNRADFMTNRDSFNNRGGFNVARGGFNDFQSGFNDNSGEGVSYNMPYQNFNMNDGFIGDNRGGFGPRSGRGGFNRGGNFNRF